MRRHVEVFVAADRHQDQHARQFAVAEEVEVDDGELSDVITRALATAGGLDHARPVRATVVVGEAYE